MVILGGPGTLIGPCLGAAVLVLMRQIVSCATQRWLMVPGVVYVATVMFLPGGLMGTISRLMLRIDSGAPARSDRHPAKSVEATPATQIQSGGES